VRSTVCDGPALCHATSSDRDACIAQQLRPGRLAAVRVSIRVRPGARRTVVGGEHDGALVVRVAARAVDGRATGAALTAVAEAFGVRRSAVTLVAGATARSKVVDVAGGTDDVLAALLAR